MTTPQLPQEIFCNFCKGNTTHICKGESHREYDDGSEWVGYKFWVCAGCGHGTLEQSYTSDWLEESDGSPRYQYAYFPPRQYGYHEPKQFKHLPKKLNGIYKETLHAMNNETLILCAIGIRTLLEGICANKKIEGRDLKTKINNLSSILPKNIISNLHSIRFLGNEAAHELTAPAFAELILAMEICEDLLNFIYELDYKASSLTQMRSQRKDQSGGIP